MLTYENYSDLYETVKARKGYISEVLQFFLWDSDNLAWNERKKNYIVLFLLFEFTIP